MGKAKRLSIRTKGTETMKPYEIKGNCCTKRAFEVAAAGNLSILLVGPRGTSKTTFRQAFPDVMSDERGWMHSRPDWRDTNE